MTNEPDDDDDEKVLSDVAYLRDLAERLTHVPVMYGTDQYDVDRLHQVVKRLNDLFVAEGWEV